MTITTGVKLVLFGWWIGVVCGYVIFAIIHCREEKRK